jgi:L-alanine-DL-glutamate epimerase-like enolase superfamily enzyme
LLSPASFTPLAAVPVNAVIAAGTTQTAITSAQQAKKNGFQCIKLKVGAQFIAPRNQPCADLMNPITTSNTIPESPVGADLSCPPPIYRPSVDVPQSQQSPVGADLSCPPPIYRPSLPVPQSPTSPHSYSKPHHYIHTEIERIAAVRNALGPDIHLRLDANEAWNLEEAIAILSQCIPYNIQYIEQPLPAGDLAGMRALRQAIPIPIAVDEALHSLESARLVLDSEAADILIIKPQLAGGLRAGQQIIQAATERGVRCVITSAIESGIGLAAALHLAAASPAVTLECGLATLHLLIDDLLIHDLPIHDGHMAVPTNPGLGVELDRQALDRYTAGGLT